MMDSFQAEAQARADQTSSLALTLRLLHPLLARPDITEICINRPCEAYLETRAGWQRESVPFADFAWCYRLAKLIANVTRQRINEQEPLLSAALPTGERVQLAIPPATTPATVSITIRKPASTVWSLDELADQGVFRITGPAHTGLDETEQQLIELVGRAQYSDFCRLAVQSKKNIVVSGPTGSGKTTWTKALIREIPATERLITIEDAPELMLPNHPNSVRLFYSKGDQGQGRLSPRMLLESCLRMRPDRILLAELRSDEAFDYLRNANSGHPGSITSVHASSAELAFEQLTLLVKQSSSGGDLPRSEIKTLLYQLIDVIIQVGVVGRRRCVQEIWYHPERRRTLGGSILPTTT